jgi:hypothetical protein
MTKIKAIHYDVNVSNFALQHRRIERAVEAKIVLFTQQIATISIVQLQNHILMS